MERKKLIANFPCLKSLLQNWSHKGERRTAWFKFRFYRNFRECLRPGCMTSQVFELPQSALHSFIFKNKERSTFQYQDFQLHKIYAQSLGSFCKLQSTSKRNNERKALLFLSSSSKQPWFGLAILRNTCLYCLFKYT